jgi:CspA family cold shock protein
MAAGKLKMWNADRGFGFIVDDAGGPDMFLHVNELTSAGIDPD